MLTFPQLVFKIYVPVVGEWFPLGGNRDWKKAWGEGWSGMLVIFCLITMLVTQLYFLCENLLSGVLRIYVKLEQKDFIRGSS